MLRRGLRRRARPCRLRYEPSNTTPQAGKLPVEPALDAIDPRLQLNVAASVYVFASGVGMDPPSAIALTRLASR